MATLPPSVPLVCAGRASDGHEDLLAELTAAGRPVVVTGFVPDDALAGLLTAATVPVAPNRVVSASGSLTTWWEHGRRPLVPDVAYTREVGRPETVVFYDGLAGSLHRAFHDDPAATWLPDGAVVGPSLAQVAADRDAWLRRWSA